MLGNSFNKEENSLGLSNFLPFVASLSFFGSSSEELREKLSQLLEFQQFLPGQEIFNWGGRNAQKENEIPVSDVSSNPNTPIYSGSFPKTTKKGKKTQKDIYILVEGTISAQKPATGMKRPKTNENKGTESPLTPKYDEESRRNVENVILKPKVVFGQVLHLRKKHDLDLKDHRYLSAKCSEMTILSILHWEKCKKILKEERIQTWKQKTQFLFEVFPFFSQNFLSRCLPIFQEVIILKDTVLFREGDAPSACFVIKEGEVSLTKLFQIKGSQEDPTKSFERPQLINKQRKPVENMKLVQLAGKELVGFEEIFDGGMPRYWTAKVTSTRLLALKITREDFEMKLLPSNEDEFIQSWRNIFIEKRKLMVQQVISVKNMVQGPGATYLRNIKEGKASQSQFQELKRAPYDLDRLKKQTKTMLKAKKHFQMDLGKQKEKTREMHQVQPTDGAHLFKTSCAPNHPNEDKLVVNDGKMKGGAQEESTISSRSLIQRKESERIDHRTNMIYQKMFDSTSKDGWLNKRQRSSQRPATADQVKRRRKSKHLKSEN